MSLSDYLRYLRALKGGLTPWEIAEGCGVSAREVHLIEVKHRRVGENDEDLQRLAGFFNVPVEELKARREAYRKRLTFFLAEAQRLEEPLVLRLESGEELGGSVLWYSRDAIALAGSSGADETVVQRAWVADWRQASGDWEVASALEGSATPAS